MVIRWCVIRNIFDYLQCNHGRKYAINLNKKLTRLKIMKLEN